MLLAVPGYGVVNTLWDFDVADASVDADVVNSAGTLIYNFYPTPSSGVYQPDYLDADSQGLYQVTVYTGYVAPTSGDPEEGGPDMFNSSGSPPTPADSDTSSFGIESGWFYVHLNKDSCDYNDQNGDGEDCSGISYAEVHVSFTPKNGGYIDLSGGGAIAFKVRWNAASLNGAVLQLQLVVETEGNQVWYSTFGEIHSLSDFYDQEKWVLIPYYALQDVADNAWDPPGSLPGDESNFAFSDENERKAKTKAIKMVVGFLPSTSQPTYDFTLYLDDFYVVKYPYIEDFFFGDFLSEHWNASVYPEESYHQVSACCTACGSNFAASVLYSVTGPTPVYTSCTFSTTASSYSSLWSRWDSSVGAAVGSFDFTKFKAFAIDFKIDELQAPENLKNYIIVFSIYIDADNDGYDASDGDEVFEYTLTVVREFSWMSLILPFEKFSDATWDNGQGDDGKDYKKDLAKFIEEYPELACKGIGFGITVSVPPLESGQSFEVRFLLDNLRVVSDYSQLGYTPSAEEVYVYPQPVRRGSVLRINGVTESAKCTIYSVEGRKMAEFRGNSFSNFKNMKPGVYYIVIEDGERKVLKFLLGE